MSATVLVDLATAPVLEVPAWRADLVERFTRGERLVTLFGRKDGADEAVLTAVLEREGTLEVTRTRSLLNRGFHELTSTFPALHCFERELHEQLGLRIADHPWLKPIRYERQQQRAMDGYPWYRIEGKEVHEVAVGPIHAGVIEPGSFRFMCLGEQVHHLEIHLGYQHRGLEPRLLEGDPRRHGPLVETIAGDTSIGHAWAWCAALERLAGVDVGLEVELQRALMLELERAAMHLAGLSGMATDIAFQQGASTYGRLRTTAINTSMRLCGNRFGRGALKPGGVGLRSDPALLELLTQNLALLRNDLAIIDEHLLGSRTVAHRLEGVGVVTTAQAKELGLVGPSARASGVSLDTRASLASSAWRARPIGEPVTFSEGDCMARAKVRLFELRASLNWLEQLVATKPPLGGARKAVGALAPKHLVVSVVEGWRGELVHALETDAHGALVHAKVQDPSLRNWMGLAVAVRKNEISDFPICNKSFDLSYCGNDL